MKLLRHLNLFAAALLLTIAHAQTTPCPGEPLIFQVEGENHGTKTWEHSTDGITWNTVVVVENDPFILQPEQSGWYRVRFHDEACGVSYVSEAQRFVAHAIELGDALTLTIGGVVRNELGGPVSGATVRAGCGAGVSTTTDHFGVFILQGVAAYEGLAHVTVEKEGYFTGSRSFVPGAHADETISYTYITLLKKNLAGTVQSASGGQVVLEGVAITFPANGFERNGQPYTGPVRVYLNRIDPTTAELNAQMPGMLMGVMNDEPQLMLSYVMVGVELSDSTGQALQLAPSNAATVRFPVLASLQSTAPAAIPLWWFDEDLGYWIQEGEGQRVGNQYVGQVAHFSWWNCDVPGNFVLLKGSVLDQGSGALLANAQIRLVSASFGTSTTYTNASGEFTGLVPINQVLTLQVWLPCGALGAQVLVNEETVGPFSAASGIMVLVEAPDLKWVMGHVLDCSVEPVEEGFVWTNGQAVFCVEGAFEFATCAANVNLRAVDLSAGNVSNQVTIELTADTTNVGDLVACASLFGTVTDIDGNLYQTRIIGAQEWMAENLRTGNYRDGTAIPNVTSDMTWPVVNSDAWCNFNNNSSHDATYGKFYNWYAAANPNICPQGWHVPTDAEWQQLEVALGMPVGELGQTGYRGTAQNVGGKMKATTLWNSPNMGATNESGFSGLPGGGRYDLTGDFYYLGNQGTWWSASESGATSAWTHFLNNNNAGSYRAYNSKRNGFCLRCVRD